MFRRMALFCTIALASCGGESASDSPGFGSDIPDPLIARALNDPLMVDPDLAYRNEANAAVTIRHDHTLPPMTSTTETAEAAREAGRRELIETGPIVDLPAASGKAQGAAFALGMTGEDLIKAAGGPSRCANQLEEGLIWAARMPEGAQVMPHGMTMQAAGVENGNCNVRIVRYVTPVSIEDALQYHYNRIRRARMEATFHSEPEAILSARGNGARIAFHARSGPNGTSAVDIVYWRR